MWKGESLRSIDEAFFRSDHGEPKDESDEIDDLIRELLSDGPVDAAEVIDTVENVIGVTARTMQRRFKDLGGQRRKVGQPNTGEKQKWEWWLSEGGTKPPKTTHTEDVAFDESVPPSGDRDPVDHLPADRIQHLADQLGATVLDPEADAR